MEEGNVIVIHLDHLTEAQAEEVAIAVTDFLNTRFPHYAISNKVAS